MSIWGTFTDRPYVPSVAYVVSPIEIEATQSVPLARTRSRRARSRLVEPPDEPTEGDEREQ
jgi:hypothetical protein